MACLPERGAADEMSVDCQLAPQTRGYRLAG
jgi:hypothetical protein